MGIKRFLAGCLVILFFPIILITDFGVWVIDKIKRTKKEITVENMWEDYHQRGIIGDESYNLIKSHSHKA